MATISKAKIFQHGGSQAVKLPRDFRFKGREVQILKTPRGVLLEPLDSNFEERRQRFIALAGSCPDLPEVPRHEGRDLARKN